MIYVAWIVGVAVTILLTVKITAKLEKSGKFDD